MLNVFFTVDVEVWCSGWTELDARFPSAFQRYIYGSTPVGQYGLPYQLRVLNDHGLKGVFFTETLFSSRFGPEPLREIVDMVQGAGQEVQLHLHTEWVNEAIEPVLPGEQKKRQNMRNFTLDEQTMLIKAGIDMLERAGAKRPNAFRAGSFGFNADTVAAVAANGLPIDASYNVTAFGPKSGVRPGELLTDTADCGTVLEYPMTVYNDGTKELRHVQLSSCSFEEIEGLLWKALREGRSSFVILSHSSELLNRPNTRADSVVVRRFHKLCAFLEKHRDKFRVEGMHGAPAPAVASQPAPLASPIHRTGGRLLEQAYRRARQRVDVEMRRVRGS
jgi:hypothetical protein